MFDAVLSNEIEGVERDECSMTLSRLSVPSNRKSHMTLHLDGKPYKPEPVIPYQFADQAPPFPEDAFPPIVRKAIADVRRVDQAPVEVVAMGALAVISIALQNRIDVVRPNRAASPVSLNLLNVSKSGDGKTVVEENFLSAITDFENEALRRQHDRLEAKARDLSFLEAAKKNLSTRISKATKLNLSLDDLKEEWNALHDEIRALESLGSSQPYWISSGGTYEGLRKLLEGEGRAIGVVSFDAGGVLICTES
jgi:hypothetical protein